MNDREGFGTQYNIIAAILIDKHDMHNVLTTLCPSPTHFDIDTQIHLLHIVTAVILHKTTDREPARKRISRRKSIPYRIFTS